MNLFQCGDFVLASGRRSTWKIECDALTPDDWRGLARMAVETVLKGLTIWATMGVPRGGDSFSTALAEYVTKPAPLGSVVVLCEDVVTTGARSPGSGTSTAWTWARSSASACSPGAPARRG